MVSAVFQALLQQLRCAPRRDEVSLEGNLAHGPARSIWRRIVLRAGRSTKSHAALCAAFLLACPLPMACSVPAPSPQAAHQRESNMLVIYYSRTGTTVKVAEAIAQATGADIERLVDTVDRAGAWGFLRSLRDAIGHRGTTLQPLGIDPTEYELVVIGTPDWGRSVSAPTRTFLETYRGRLRQVAFFLTDGKSDHAGIFREMASLAGKEPVASLGIPHDDVVKGDYAPQVQAFVESLHVPPPLEGHAKAPAATQ